MPRYDDDMPDEPYGAQVLRRLHDDDAGRLRDYDEMMDYVDDPHVRKYLAARCHQIAKDLDSNFDVFVSHPRYKDLPLPEGFDFEDLVESDQRLRDKERGSEEDRRAEEDEKERFGGYENAIKAVSDYLGSLAPDEQDAALNDGVGMGMGMDDFDEDEDMMRKPFSPANELAHAPSGKGLITHEKRCQAWHHGQQLRKILKDLDGDKETEDIITQIAELMEQLVARTHEFSNTRLDDDTQEKVEKSYKSLQQWKRYGGLSKIQSYRRNRRRKAYHSDDEEGEEFNLNLGGVGEKSLQAIERSNREASRQIKNMSDAVASLAARL